MTENANIPQNRIWIYKDNYSLCPIRLDEINENKNRRAKHFFKNMKPNEFALIKAEVEVLNCLICKKDWAVSGEIPNSLRYYADRNDLVAPCIDCFKKGYYSQSCYHCKEELPWRQQGYAGGMAYCDDKVEYQQAYQTLPKISKCKFVGCSKKVAGTSWMLEYCDKHTLEEILKQDKKD